MPISYYNPKQAIRLSAYADTIVLEPDGREQHLRAIRFGGYPEMVRAMADAIYAGATLEAEIAGEAATLSCEPKKYECHLSHDGIYAEATILSLDDEDTAAKKDEEAQADGQTNVELPPRKCVLFCPAGDRRALFEALDRKTAVPLIPEFQDYVLDELQRRRFLKPLRVISIRERLEAWLLLCKKDDANIVKVLEEGLKTGAIHIPGTVQAPHGFDDVHSVTSYLELAAKSNVYKLPLQPSSPNTTSREPYALEQRHAAYSEMLSLLTLSDRHRDNLHERGLPDAIIERNGYKSTPETESERRLLASLLRCNHELHGLPGFYTKDGAWTLAGANGFLIPVRNNNGLIQGMKIRLDDDAARKYRWLSSRSSRMENGTRSYSWIHVTGDTTQKCAYLTEGPLKGDIASYFANNALFVCLGGVNAHKGLRETLLSLGVTEVMEAMDMDQFTNPQVRQAVLTLRREVQSIPGIRYYQCTWNPRFKGVDDYLLDWTKRKTA